MQFFSFGLNHHKAPVEIRDRYAFAEADLRSLYRDLQLSHKAEYIIVSTCNRLECFLYGHEEDVHMIQNALVGYIGEDWPDSFAFYIRDEEAVSHLLEIAVGLDSMVIGDAQILSQVKEAYRWAVEEDVVHAVLHRLMHTAFSAAKRIVNETRLSSGTSSLAGTAAALTCKLLREHSCSEPEGVVCILGAGEMGRLVLDALYRESNLDIILTNRNENRLNQVAEPYSRVRAVSWDDRYKAILESDVILVATAASHFVVSHEDLPPLNDKEEVAFIDIAMPRNVDPGIDAISGYTVYNLDDLQREIENVIFLRQSDIPPARKICEDMLADFVSWVFHHEALQPAIQAIHSTFESIRRQEIERHHHRFSDIDKSELDRLTQSIMQKVLAVPVVRLKNVGLDHIDYVNGIKLLQSLFARPSCEDDLVSSSYDLSEEIVDVLANPDKANLARLAGCPFHEKTRSDVDSVSSRSMPFNTDQKVIIGTRGSALAMWQTGYIKKKLESVGFEVQVEKIVTKGDRILDKPFSAIDGKSLFTKEIDQALLEGRIDLAVHSLKDLPSELPEGLALAAIPEREQPFDVFVAHPSFEGTLDELPIGAVIGTSSLRRSAQLKAWRPDIRIVPLRGNVDTRIKKLDQSDWYGIILAAAGLRRLGLESRIHTTLSFAPFLPAPGQGALGIVCAEANTSLVNILRRHLHHEASALGVSSERMFLHALDGGCHVPVGALSRKVGDEWVLEGYVGSVDGTCMLRDTVRIHEEDPAEAGIRLARHLLDKGAADILEQEKEALLNR